MAKSTFIQSCRDSLLPNRARPALPAWVLICLVGCLEALSIASAASPAPVNVEGSVNPAKGDQRQVVVIPHELLGRSPRRHIDPCCMDPEGAMMVLDKDELANLNLPFINRGSLVDYVRRFRPNRTMAAVGVPSISLLLGEPPPTRQARRQDGEVLPLTYDRYHTPDEGIAAFQAIAAKYPHLARFEVLGQSVEGRDLVALRLSDHPGLEENGEHKIFFCALHHAREWATHEMALFLAESLVTQYETHPRVRNILNRSVVWVLLNQNPDGFEYSWETDRLWRKNRRPNRDGLTVGVDLNRNYNFRWGVDNLGSSSFPGDQTYRGPAPESEPETRAVQAFLERERPIIALSYHTYSQLVLYPWGYTGSLLPQGYTALRAIGDHYARIVLDDSGMNYLPGQGNYTIYPTNGDFTDYAYGVHGVLAFTPELRPISSEFGGFLLPEEEILPNNQENYAAALWLMDSVADIRFVPAPQRDYFGPAWNPFSLPLTPTNVRPDRALSMASSVAGRVNTWFSDEFHPIPVFVNYPSIEGVGPGAPLFLNNIDAVTRLWAGSFTGYEALPNILDCGAIVPVETFQGGDVNIGIPSEFPVRLRDVRIAKRIIARRDTDFGLGEWILESRSAMEDEDHPDSWINWRWSSASAGGTTIYAHPEGAEGAEEWLYPFRAYSFFSNVRSWAYGGTTVNHAVYLLMFPPPVRGDMNGDTSVTLDDHAAALGCLSGPDAPWGDEACAAVDIDRSLSVDLRDMAAFQVEFGGTALCAP